MANFSKIFGLAGAAVMFTGLAYGQATCTTLTTAGGPTFIRAEGQTELIPTLNLACTGVAGASLNLTVFISPGITITSKLLNSGTGQVEATATANGPGGGSVQGTIQGSSIVFSGITLGAGTTNVQITNIRINATGIPSSVGAPPTTVSAQAFVGGTNVTPGANTNANPAVAFALNGLGAVKLFQDAANTKAGIAAASLGVCNSITAQNGTPAAPNAQFFIQINEAFQNAFKTAADESSQTPVVISGVSNAVNSGTRLKLVFNNVPAGGLQLYLPTQVAAGDGAVLTLTGSETAGFSAVTAITGQSNISSLGPVAQVSVSGTSATAIYEVTGDNTQAIDTFSIPVYAIAGSNTLSAQAAAMTLSVSFAPIAPATTVPSFAVGTSTSAINTLSFVTCQTSLLFPFVTNQNGFETGIAIDNTTMDPFGTKPQSGVCTLNFYGVGGGTNPTAGPAPNAAQGAGMPYQAGQSYAFTLTSALQSASSTNPATFQGYIIAQCNFQFAHGFAYIVYGFPGTSSDTMGYLALVLNDRGSVGAEVTMQ